MSSSTREISTGPVPNCSQSEYLRTFILSVISILFSIYLKVAGCLLRLMMPLTKRIVTKRMLVFDLDINGTRPHDPQVKNDELFIRAALEGETGMYESYVDGYWDSKDLVATFETCMKTRKTRGILHPLSWTLEAFNLQKGQAAWAVASEHYDIGNDLYQSMLDDNMQYTCGYWERAGNLNEAQLDKMELIGRKLQLQEKGLRVLDIGCGFGTLAKYLAEQYESNVVGCSISTEQTRYARDACEKAGLNVNFIVCDYRDLINLYTKEEEKFDRVVSVGMFEHVGNHNYKEFFEIVNHCLKPNGLFLLHTIGNNHKAMPCVSMWLHRHIFPNSRIPYYKDIANGIESLFVIEDWQNFGHDYSRTLQAWRNNFESAWESSGNAAGDAVKPKLSTMYGPKFYRMWTLYLSLSQAAFQSRSFQLWQIVLSKDGVEGGYSSKRLSSS